MATVINATPEASQAPQRMFVGKAWINTVREGKHQGTAFISLKLDRNIGGVTIGPNDQITLWPNQKRDGKKDADYRVSIK